MHYPVDSRLSGAATLLLTIFLLADLSLAQVPQRYRVDSNGTTYVLIGANDITQARAIATSVNGQIVSIDSQAKNDLIRDEIRQSYETEILIGLSDVITEGTFLWEDGSPATYTNWSFLEPSNFDGWGGGANADYVVMIHSGRWADTTNTRRPTLIELPTPPAPMIVATTYHNGKGYHLITATSMIEARLGAGAIPGGHLVAINDSAEQSALVSAFSPWLPAYTGLTDEVTEGTYVWDSREPVTYAAFAANSAPNDADTDFVLLDDTGLKRVGATYPSYVNAIVEFTPEDIEVESIDVPGEVQGPAFDVVITIKNNGASSHADIPVSFKIDDGPEVTDVVAGPLAPGASMQFTFSTQAVLPQTSVYALTCTAALEADTTPGNDTKTVNVHWVEYVGAGEFPYFEDFENGPGGWFADTFAFNTHSWVVGNTISGTSSGNNAWATGWTGTNGEHSWVESPRFDFSNLSHPMLLLDITHEIHGQGAEDGYIESSTDGGASWQTVNSGELRDWPGGSAPSFTGNRPWRRAAAMLVGLAGQPDVRFRVRLVLNGINSFVYEPGIAFDDVQIVDQASYPIGTYEGVGLAIGINGSTLVDPMIESEFTRVANPADIVSVRISGPGSLLGAPMVLAADVAPMGVGFDPIAAFPALHISLNAVVINSNPFFTPVVGPQPMLYHFGVPNIVGTDVLFQNIVDPSAANGFFATSDGILVEVR